MSKRAKDLVHQMRLSAANCVLEASASWTSILVRLPDRREHELRVEDQSFHDEIVEELRSMGVTVTELMPG